MKKVCPKCGEVRDGEFCSRDGSFLQEQVTRTEVSRPVSTKIGSSKSAVIGRIGALLVLISILFLPQAGCEGLQRRDFTGLQLIQEGNDATLSILLILAVVLAGLTILAGNAGSQMACAAGSAGAWLSGLYYLQQSAQRGTIPIQIQLRYGFFITLVGYALIFGQSAVAELLRSQTDDG